MARVYNFSAGPSMLPEKVLKQAQAELLEYGDSGQSVMEMSHRSKWFDAIIKDTEATLRRVMTSPTTTRCCSSRAARPCSSPPWHGT